MTIAQLLLATIGSQFLYVLTKLMFINVLNIESTFLKYVMWLVLAVISIAIVRRLGPLNYLESFFITILWFVISLIVDLAITTAFTGRDVYKTWYFWISYGVIMVTLIIFHKKFHVENRRAMQGK